MAEKESIVFVVAHPDDVTYSAGGTAWLLHEKYDLHVLCASKGERGYTQTEREKFEGTPPPSAELAAIREGEEKKACEILGASLTFLGQIDGEIHPDREVCDRVAGILADIRPKAVLTHGPLEKKDHSAVFSIAYQALHLADVFWTTDLCMFHHDAGTYNTHAPCLYVNISDVIEHKADLVRCHQTQFRHSLDSVLERNRILGQMVYADYAEAFQTCFPPMGRRWDRDCECGKFLLDL